MRIIELFKDSKPIILDGSLDEVAPPGEKAERFIKKRKKEFKKRYGDKGEQILYATAWKKFGK